MKKKLPFIAKVAMPSAIFTVTSAIMPAFAQDQRDALLEAALRRITALETKVGKIDSLEQENRQLRSKLTKTQGHRDTFSQASTKSDQSVIAKDSYAFGSVDDQAGVMPRTNRWQGFYAGINAGYGANNINTYTSNITVDKASGFIEEAVASRTLGYVGGGLAGGQFGYNHVFANHIMVGAEADMNWADIYNNVTPTSTTQNVLQATPGNLIFPLPREVMTNTTSNYQRVGLDWMGTVRARVGYDLGSFLPYITGGLAYGGLSSQLGDYDYGVSRSVSFQPPALVVEPVGSRTTGYTSTVNVGWALGAGAEFMVADGWSVKGEYLYTSIGGVSMPHYSQSTEASDTKTYTTEQTGSFGVHQARVGLNYHPGWSFTEPVALFAKY